MTITLPSTINIPNIENYFLHRFSRIAASEKRLGVKRTADCSDRDFFQNVEENLDGMVSNCKGSTT